MLYKQIQQQSVTVSQLDTKLSADIRDLNTTLQESDIQIQTLLSKGVNKRIIWEIPKNINLDCGPHVTLAGKVIVDAFDQSTGDPLNVNAASLATIRKGDIVDVKRIDDKHGVSGYQVTYDTGYREFCVTVPV